jgi:hypothetical protein
MQGNTVEPMLGRSQPFMVGFDPLSAVPKPERTARLGRYLDYLKTRDGTADLPKRSLSERDRFFGQLAGQPVRWQGDIGAAAFQEHLKKKLEKRDLDRRIVWLLAAAKANRAEQYGVDLDLELRGDHFGEYEHGEHMTFIDLEEFYHTRILRDCCNIFGLSFDMHPPKSFVRWFTKLVVKSPPYLRLVTAMLGEFFGCVAFQVLWETADVFKEQPAVFERLRLLVREILVDELGHVAYANSNLGSTSLSLVKSLMPMVSAYFLNDLPEFEVLAGGRDVFLKRVAAFDLQNSELWARTVAAA